MPHLLDELLFSVSVHPTLCQLVVVVDLGPGGVDS